MLFMLAMSTVLFRVSFSPLCIEDVAIAYGYNNIKRAQPPTLNIGSEQPINQL